MRVAINKWGNSYGIRVPKMVMEALSLTTVDKLDLSIVENALVFKKAENSLKGTAARLQKYTGDYRGQEADTGQPVGNEVW